MKIINAMFGRGRGGIEQAALDYALALASRGHEVTTLLHPESAMRDTFAAEALSVESVSNFARWDPFAVGKLKALLAAQPYDIVICHGNRAISLLTKAATMPVVGVAHNYKLKHFKKLDAAFAITRDLVEEVMEASKLPRERVFYMPNSIEVPQSEPRAFHSPPVIGSMGRFVAKKGFDVFIRALALLHKRGVAFTAVLGGDGEEKAALEKLAESLGLGDGLRFTGWVENKRAFFESIDVFCLPSHHEPFGIVLLEAFAHYTPVVTTDSEGPADMVRPNIEVLMVEKNNPQDMAHALEEIVSHPDSARGLALAAHDRLQQRFSRSVVAEQMSAALEAIINGHTL